MDVVKAHGHEALAAVLEEHRTKLQQYLADWSLEQVRILQPSPAGVFGGSCSMGSQQTNDFNLEQGFGAQCIQTFSQSTNGTSPMVNRMEAQAKGALEGCKVSVVSHEGSEVNTSGTMASAPTTKSTMFGAMFSARESMNASMTASIAVRDKLDEIKTQLRSLNFQRTRTRSTIVSESSGVQPSSRVSRLIAPVVQSSKFDSFCVLVILLNACVMGVSADYAIKNPRDPEISVLEFLEQAFCVFYTFEVFMRLLVNGRDYICGPGCSWNWFDVLLVVQSLYDQIQTAVLSNVQDGAVNNFSFLRMLRLMKMLKLLRIIRLMKMFKELRMMLFSMLGSMKAMAWACIFIAIISYMFGICVLQGCTIYLQAGGGSEKVFLIHKYWGSIGDAMLSIFKSSTAGVNWSDIAEPLEDVGVFFYALFVLYIAFFAFVVVNTLTSIFVEVTMENSEKDNQMVIQLELEKKNVYMNRLQAFYDEINTNDENGCISYEDFCKHMRNPKILAFAASLDLDILNAKQFFFMLSENGTRPVDVETFVLGCIKLKGLAKNMDLMDLMYSFKKTARDQKQYFADVTKQLDAINKILSGANFEPRLAGIARTLSTQSNSLKLPKMPEPKISL